MSALPKFRYYPAATEATIEEGPVDCIVCEKEREYVYTGPVFHEEELDNQICPWCIADGSAQEKFSAMFNPIADFASSNADDIEPVSMSHNRLGEWENVSQSIVEEIAYRTPGILCWQEAQWFFCCNDAAVYLGPMGTAELKKHGPAAYQAIRQSIEPSMMDESAVEEWMSGLSAENSPTAYLFQCAKCKAFGGFSDCD